MLVKEDLGLIKFGTSKVKLSKVAETGESTYSLYAQISGAAAAACQNAIIARAYLIERFEYEKVHESVWRGFFRTAIDGEP